MWPLADRIRSYRRLYLLSICVAAVVDCDGNGPVEPPLPQGTSLAFVSNRDGAPDIYLMEGTHIQRLTNNAMHESTIVWSPEGGRMAFASDGRLWGVNADGSGLTDLTASVADFVDWPAQWSPDGTRLLYTRVGFEAWWVRAVSSDRTNDVVIANAVDPSWSSDGMKIAVLIRDLYSSTPTNDVHVVNADGSGLTNLTNNTVIEWLPSWSPDGTTIAFARFDGIYTMNPDGTPGRRLTNLRADHVVWSRDSKQIAWSSGDCCYDPPKTELYVVSVAGTARRLATVDGYINRIDWSPNGDRIAFSTGAETPRALFVVKADGTGLVRIGESGSDYHSPAWRPRSSF